MKALITADLQLDSRTTYGDRLSDNRATLTQIAELAHAGEVDLIIIAGDVFQHRKPAPDELLAFADFLRELAPIPVRIILGNHDVRGVDQVSAVDLFDSPSVRVVDYPVVEDVAGTAIAYMPWSHPGHLRARLSGGGPSELEDALLRTASDLLDGIDGTGATAVLVTHYALSGMSTPTGLPTSALIGEPVLNLHELARQGWDHVFAGHVHKRENVIVATSERGLDELAPKMSAWSIGSPWRHDFGEESIEPGVILFNSGPGAALVVPTSDRPFVTVDEHVSAAAIALDTGDVRNLNAMVSIQDAIVRVRLSGTEEEVANLDVAAVRAMLLDAGAHKVHSVQFEVYRSVRARADVAVDAEPMAALGAYIDANFAAIPGSRADELRDLTRELLKGEE